MNKTYINTLKLTVFFIASFCALNISIIAQPAPLAINEVEFEKDRANPNDPTDPFKVERLIVSFNRPISTEKAKPTDADTELSFLVSNPQIYTVIRRNPADNSVKTFKISSVKAHCCIKEWIYLFPIVGNGEKFFQVNHQYIFIIDDPSKVVFKKPITVTINAPLQNTSGDEVTDAEQKKISNPATFDVRPSKSKDDSNVYLAGELTGATGSKPNFSVDIKINTPFVAKKPEARFFFDLKANSNSDADPDSLNIGFEYASQIKRKSKATKTIQGLENCIGALCEDQRNQPNRWLTQVNYSLYAKIESDREFDNTNFITGGSLTLPLARFTRSQRVEFNLFLGSDFGKNLKSPVLAAEGRAIVRPYAGVSTFIGFLRKEDFFPFSFEGNYTNRWLLTRELKLKKDDDGNLVAAFFDKEPRFYIETKFNFQFNPYFGLFAGYEYGEKPPDYKLVNNSFKFGLVYKFKFKGAGEN